MKKVASLFIVLAFVASALSAASADMQHKAFAVHPAQKTTASSMMFLHAQGTQIVDGAGNQVLLRGAEIESAFDDMANWKSGVRLSHILNSTVFNSMVQVWKMNTLRLCLSNWTWAADPTTFIQQLDTIVQEANAAGLYVVLNLHDDGKAGSPYGDTADLPKTEDNTFWQAMALHYAANPMVLFDLYNEPKDTSWSQWLNGGGNIGGATIVGHQTMVNTIRAEGAQQIVIAEPGSSGGPRFKGWSSVGSNTINDPNVMYSLHVYDHINDTPQQDDALWGSILHHYPLDYGEWALLVNGTGLPGYDHCKAIPPNQANQVVINFLNYMNNQQASWTAWDFNPYHLILDYKHFAPTTLNIPWKCGQPSQAGMGTLVKRFLTSLSH